MAFDSIENIIEINQRSIKYRRDLCRSGVYSPSNWSYMVSLEIYLAAYVMTKSFDRLQVFSQHPVK